MKTIGKLNKRIKFAAPLEGRDDLYGGMEQRFVESVEVWAVVEFIETKSDEKVSADQLSAHTNTLFTIRTKTGLHTEMRIIYNGRYYEILSILPQKSRMYTKIETVQIEANVVA